MVCSVLLILLTAPLSFHWNPWLLKGFRTLRKESESWNFLLHNPLSEVFSCLVSHILQLNSCIETEGSTSFVWILYFYFLGNVPRSLLWLRFHHEPPGLPSFLGFSASLLLYLLEYNFAWHDHLAVHWSQGSCALLQWHQHDMVSFSSVWFK